VSATKLRGLGLGALLLGGLALWAAPRDPAPAAVVALPDVPVRPSAVPEAQGPSGLRSRAPEIEEAGEVEAVIGQLTLGDRRAEEEAQISEARTQRRRLLDRNLADLGAAAERAEREGKPEYAAALRRRAEILEQSVQLE
jgi:hypothetical protein